MEDRVEMLTLFGGNQSIEGIAGIMGRSASTVENHLGQMGFYRGCDPVRVFAHDQDLESLASLEGVKVGVVPPVKERPANGFAGISATAVSATAPKAETVEAEAETSDVDPNDLDDLLHSAFGDYVDSDLGAPDAPETPEDGWSEVTRVLRYAEWAHDRIVALEAEIETLTEANRNTSWLKDRARRVLQMVKGDQRDE